MKKKSIVFILALGAALAVFVIAQEKSNSSKAPPADTDAIRQTALDYIEGWYEGNAERMERSLHPDLAKRIVQTNAANGRGTLGQQSALTLVQYTRAHAKSPTPKEQQQKDITILDVFENAASVKVVASEWIDYLHVGKFNGRWVIINVLWELKPAKK